MKITVFMQSEMHSFMADPVDDVGSTAGATGFDNRISDVDVKTHRTRSGGDGTGRSPEVGRSSRLSPRFAGSSAGSKNPWSDLIYKLEQEVARLESLSGPITVERKKRA